MRIAVNTCFIEGHHINNRFYRQLFLRLAALHPDHDFLFLFQTAQEQWNHLPSNVTSIIVPGNVSNSLSLKWWLDVKLPFALRKYKLDILIHPGAVCSLTTRTPQLIIHDDLSVFIYPKLFASQHLLFYKTYTAKFFRKAKVIATTTEVLSKEIAQRFKVASGKIWNVGAFANPIFKPLNWEEKELVKEKYAEGFDYFIFVGGLHPRHNLLNLLKAFSQFKVRQRSSIKLLVVAEIDDKHKDILEKLNTYKFKDEVKLIDNLLEDEYVKLFASAYALVFPGFFQGLATPVLEAMQCEVPVIVTHNSSMNEIGGDAVLYADPNDPVDIAKQLKLIFKDENLRGQLIDKGKLQALNYNWDKTTTLLWQAIEQAVSK